MGKHGQEDKLDAFGHLNWTVGNEDWIACFDAIRKGKRIHYEVVVDSESGGFVDTIEKGSVSVRDIGQLFGLPDYWAGICYEHYAGSLEPEHQIDDAETLATQKRWIAHLKDLAQETAK